MFFWIWNRFLSIGISRIVLIGIGIACVYYHAFVSPEALHPYAKLEGTEINLLLQRISHNKMLPPVKTIQIPEFKEPASKYDVTELDQYFEAPLSSSSVLQMVNGREFLDKRIVEASLSCETVIYPDKLNAYGKCKNFTNMRFIDGSRTVAMASFPGSGSTWMRSILEQITGIYTGSVYCDKDLKSKGFVGERITSSNVLFVKTHSPNKNFFIPLKLYYDLHKFKNIMAAILLVRNPLDSIVSYWNYERSSHTATAPPHTYGNFSAWRRFVNKNAKEFTKLVHYWLEEANIPSVLVIKYEDLLSDLPTQLRKMLNFLQVPYSDKDFECVVGNKLENFHRPKGKPFDHYIPADRRLVLDNLMSVEPVLNKHNISYKDVFIHSQT